MCVCGMYVRMDACMYVCILLVSYSLMKLEIKYLIPFFFFFFFVNQPGEVICFKWKLNFQRIFPLISWNHLICVQGNSHLQDSQTV
jgi:hypothetical protein